MKASSGTPDLPIRGHTSATGLGTAWGRPSVLVVCLPGHVLPRKAGSKIHLVEGLSRLSRGVQPLALIARPPPEGSAVRLDSRGRGAV
jgi:hypothetical protein